MRFQVLSIRTRLLLLTLGLLVPLVAVGFFNLWEFRSSRRAQLEESLRQQAGLAAAAFEQRILAYRQTLEAVSVLANNNESRLALQDYLNSIVKTRPNWLDIQIVDGAGHTILSQTNSGPFLSSTPIAPLIQNADQANSFVISTDQMAGDSSWLLSIARPVGNGTFVMARIDGASIGEVFKNLKFAGDNIIAVFDENNRLIYRSRASPEQMSLDVSETPLLSALNEKREGIIEVESPYDGIGRVYGLARIGTLNKVVIVGVPSTRLYESAQQQFTRLLLFSLFFLIVAIAAAYAIARSITGPTSALALAAHRFGSGDFAARTDLVNDRAFGELGATFNKMAEQISEREVELQALDRLKSEFVSSVSHELRTPLTTIKTLARVLQSDKISERDRTEYLETIAAECDRQIAFVQALLDLSRIESGAYKVSLATTDVIKVVGQSLAAKTAAAATRNLTLVFEPSNLKAEYALTDPAALRRIVSDIIDNAIKYSFEGTEIVISAEEKGDRIAVAISDSGCGIAADDLPQIFEKFYRGGPLHDMKSSADTGLSDPDHTPPNETPGVGLGLYLVHSLVKQIGAEIHVESPVPGTNEGAQFTLLLPAVESV